jgi:aminoglycoside/choline kinase family phosphotransferase
LHAAWWNHPRLESLAWMPVANDPINKAGVSLFPQAWQIFQQRFGDELPAEMHATGEKLCTAVGGILDQFVDVPLTICHGDVRLDNLFFGSRPGDPSLKVIDWQIGIRGIGTYDVGYFMSQSLNVDVRRKHEEDLLKHYHGLLTEGGVSGYSYDEMLHHYRWTLLFCMAYPVMGGGLGDLGNERGYQLVRAMRDRSTAAIMDWKAGELLG